MNKQCDRCGKASKRSLCDICMSQVETHDIYGDEKKWQKK